MNASHAPVPNRQRQNAQRMRRSMTDAEKKLWHELRAHRLMGLGFRRQYPVRGYIADFACPAHRLIIEVDGSHHGRDDISKRDARRTSTLEADGWMIVRFWNDDVLQNLEAVCNHIVTVIQQRKP